MPYPAYVPTRTVSVGGAVTLEGAEDLRLVLTLESTRSLVWDATGYRFEAQRVSLPASAPGTEVTTVLPRTDVAGWRDGRTGAVIDVSVPDSHSHTYRAVISFLTAEGKTAPIAPVTIGPFVLPEGDGSVVDLDKTVPVGTVAGQALSVPDSWSALVASAEAAAAEAAASLASIGTPDVTATANSIPKRTPGGTLKTATPVDVDDAARLVDVQAAVSASTADAVRSTGIGRLVAVPEGDPLPTLQDGDLVVRYLLAGASYVTDFSDYATGVQPSDWTVRWATGGTWTVEADAAATGGKVLRSATTGGGRRAFTWNLLDSDADRADVEILTRWRSGIPNVLGGVVARASGAAAAETGYRAGGSTGPVISASRYLAGANTDLATGTRSTPVVDAWHLTRFRVAGDTVQAKSWRDGTAEPATWQASGTDTAITDPGWVGLIVTQATNVDFDWVAVGTGGRKAVAP